MFQHQEKSGSSLSSFRIVDNTFKLKDKTKISEPSSLQNRTNKDSGDTGVDFASHSAIGNSYSGQQIQTKKPEGDTNNPIQAQLQQKAYITNRLNESTAVRQLSTREKRNVQLKQQEEEIRQNKPYGMAKDTFLKLSDPKESNKMIAQTKFARFKKGQAKQLKRNKMATMQFKSRINNFETELIQRRIDYGSEEYINLLGERFPEYLAFGQMNENAGTIQNKDSKNGIHNIESEHKTQNSTGLPLNLKTGIQDLSGIDMGKVQVYRNSPKPAEVGALAFTEGTDIHIAQGQEKHLPHEAWHVVQQMQGRVQPNTSVNGMAVNDDNELEKEADIIGNQLQHRTVPEVNSGKDKNLTNDNSAAQNVKTEIKNSPITDAKHDGTTQKKKSEFNSPPYLVRQMKNISNVFNHFKSTRFKNRKVAQLVKAYRIGTTKSKYKIKVSDGSITEFSGGTTGIDISFGDEKHAQYYFKTKSNDKGAEMVSWDFPNNFYDMILFKMRKGNVEKGKNWNQLKMWKAVKNKSAPVNSSDTIVNKGKLIAPHFKTDWIDPLNKYGRGSNAQVTKYDDFFDNDPEYSEEESDQQIFNDAEEIFMYQIGNEKNGIICKYGERKDYMNDGEDWEIISMTTAVERNLIKEEDLNPENI